MMGARGYGESARVGPRGVRRDYCRTVDSKGNGAVINNVLHVSIVE